MAEKPSMTANDVVTEKLETPFKGFFQMDRYHIRHKRFDGGWTDTFSREIFERGHAVACVLFDPKLDVLVMVEQFRIGAYAALNSPWYSKAEEKDSPWLLEHIAGIIDEGESPEEVVRREAMEEAGVLVTDILPIHKCLMTPGGSSESCHIYCGRVDAANAGGIHGLEHENEDIKVHVIPTKKAFELLALGRTNNAMTVIGLQWLQLNHADLLRRWS